MGARLKKASAGGDAAATAIVERMVDEIGLRLAQVELVCCDAWVPAPSPPEIPKPARLDAIAGTILRLTGSRSVAAETVRAVYVWLFADEALYLDETEMRIEACRLMSEVPGRREVSVPHPSTGKPVLVTWEEISEHAEIDGKVLEAEERWERVTRARQARMVEVLRPFFLDEKTTVATAAGLAARHYGIDPTGRDTNELIDLVLAAAGPVGPATTTDERPTVVHPRAEST